MIKLEEVTFLTWVDTSTHRYVETPIRRYVDTSIREYVDTWIRRHTDTSRHRYVETPIRRYVDTSIRRHTDTSIRYCLFWFFGSGRLSPAVGRRSADYDRHFPLQQHGGVCVRGRSPAGGIVADLLQTQRGMGPAAAVMRAGPLPAAQRVRPAPLRGRQRDGVRWRGAFLLFHGL